MSSADILQLIIPDVPTIEERGHVEWTESGGWTLRLGVDRPTVASLPLFNGWRDPVPCTVHLADGRRLVGKGHTMDPIEDPDAPAVVLVITGSEAEIYEP